MNSSSLRMLVAATGFLLLASCSSSDDQALSTASTVSTTTEATATEATATEATAAEAVEETTTTVDNRTDEEKAIDRLDLLMFDLGVTDLESSSNCVVDRLESENIDLTGEGTAELVALFGCDENALSLWLPESNGTLPDETWACTVESLRDWINPLTIPEAEAFFGAAEPPTEFIELTATRCSVDEADLLSAF